MFELLVPATAAQLKRLKDDKKDYDVELRPQLMVQAIQELQDVKVEPDVWKIEGLDRREDCDKVVAAARRGGRARVGCIILGRGEDDTKVRHWLTTASTVPGFIGFAVGRTSFWDPLIKWRQGEVTREAAASLIANRYLKFVKIFEEKAYGAS
jgi:5-dehydro-2-deoxygluconokinase